MQNLAHFIKAMPVAVILLAGCHHKEHEHSLAVDKVEEAAALAREKAPAPEEYTFKETLPPAPGAKGYTPPTNTNSASTDTASSATASDSTANADAPSDTKDKTTETK